VVAVALGVLVVREAVAETGAGVGVLWRVVLLLLLVVWRKVLLLRGLVIRPEGSRVRVLVVLGVVLLCGRVEVTVAAYCVMVTVVVTHASFCEGVADGVFWPALAPGL
jgi:hypothetical protein